MQSFTKIFQKILLESKDLPSKLFHLKEEIELSSLYEKSEFQEGIRFRAQFYGTLFAELLIDENGDFKEKFLSQLEEFLSRKGHILGPFRENDSLILGHIQKILKFLKTPEIQKIFKHFRPPLSHRQANHIIRQTLRLEKDVKLETYHIRRAVLSALLTPLRQNIGSCFASAPAILIQKNQPELFLKDMLDLLDKGKLERVVSGKSFSVPFSLSWGIGDLARPLPSQKYLKFNPSTLSALEAVSLIDRGIPLKDKVLQLDLILAQAAGAFSNVKELVEITLMEKYGIDKELIEKEKRLEKNRVISQDLQFQGFGISEMSKKVQGFEKEYLKALSAFNRMTDNPLLKSWEFTLASFADVKVDFAKWNLFVSLGLDIKEDGLGRFLYNLINERLKIANDKVMALHDECNQEYDHVRMFQGMVSTNLDPNRQSFLARELSSSELKWEMVKSERDKAVLKTEEYAQLFAYLLELYLELFPTYFQELYDPEMLTASSTEFSDSPAGFRLVYKHGRNDPSSWTMIYDADGYIKALRDFLVAIESEILNNCSFKEVVDELADLFLEQIRFIESELFLHGALRRMAIGQKAATQKTSIEEISKREKKPWSYTAGGTMVPLLKTYYRREKSLTSISIEPNTDEELFKFLLDQNLEYPDLLMSSPTHAFIFQPTKMTDSLESDTIESWKNKCIKFNQENLLQESMIQNLLIRFCSHQSFLEAHLLTNHFPNPISQMNICDFRNNLIRTLENFSREGYSLDWTRIVDGFLYESLPLFKREEIFDVIGNLARGLVREDQVRKFLIDSDHRAYFSKHETFQLSLELILESNNSLFTEKDLYAEIAERGRSLGLFPPKPVCFADSNWAAGLFYFVVGFSNAVELWLLDSVGMKGFPMKDWKNSQGKWIVYNKPEEYS